MNIWRHSVGMLINHLIIKLSKNFLIISKRQAPEVILNRLINQKSDVYSFGLSMLLIII